MACMLACATAKAWQSLWCKGNSVWQIHLVPRKAIQPKSYRWFESFSWTFTLVGTALLDCSSCGRCLKASSLQVFSRAQELQSLAWRGHVQWSNKSSFQHCFNYIRSRLLLMIDEKLFCASIRSSHSPWDFGLFLQEHVFKQRAF